MLHYFVRIFLPCSGERSSTGSAQQYASRASEALTSSPTHPATPYLQWSTAHAQGTYGRMLFENIQRLPTAHTLHSLLDPSRNARPASAYRR